MHLPLPSSNTLEYLFNSVSIALGVRAYPEFKRHERKSSPNDHLAVYYIAKTLRIKKIILLNQIRIINGKLVHAIGKS